MRYFCLWNCSWLPYPCSYIYLFVTTAALKIVIHWSSWWPKVQCWIIKQELNNSPFLSTFSSQQKTDLTCEWKIWFRQIVSKTNPLILNHQPNHHVWFSSVFIKTCSRLIPICLSTVLKLNIKNVTKATFTLISIFQSVKKKMVTKNYDPATKIVGLVASYLLDNLILSLATVHIS